MKPILDLSDQTVIVAGAGGGGIGTAITLMLARAGARVAGVDKSMSQMESLREELPALDQPHVLIAEDLLVSGAADRVMAAVESDLGQVTGLVNVVGGFQSMEQMAPLISGGSEAHFKSLLDFNLSSALSLSIAVARSLKGRASPGSVVNITSSTGLISMPYGAGYAAAKAALNNLTRTMAVEWGGAGIRVNAVSCGTIMSAEARRWAEGVEEAARHAVPLGRCGEPEEIAATVAFLLSDLASYISGEVICVDGGALARAPYNDGNNIPLFITDQALHERLLSDN